MKVLRHPTAESFLKNAQPWLMRAEVENNVILGIAMAIAQQSLIPNELPYFVTAVDNEEVAACAVRTPPHKLLVSRADTVGVGAIARDAFVLYPELQAASGPEPAAGAFASAWAALSGSPVRIGMKQRIYVIRSLEQHQTPASGLLRRAAESDLGTVVPWVGAFVREANLPEKSDPTDVARRFLKYGGLFVWDDGGPVSMAAFGGTTPNGVRVSLVYTPPTVRRRGYATAAVTALTRLLLEEGKRYCCLYTDLANPISNRVYQRIGYRPLCDVNDYVLAG